MVGEGDQVHSALAQQFVEPHRIGGAVRYAEFSQEPFRRALAKFGVKVKVRFHGETFAGNRRQAYRANSFR